MLVTQQPVLREFWHAVMPLSALADGPQLVALLGDNIDFFLDAEGAPAAQATVVGTASPSASLRRRPMPQLQLNTK